MYRAHTIFPRKSFSTGFTRKLCYVECVCLIELLNIETLQKNETKLQLYFKLSQQLIILFYFSYKGILFLDFLFYILFSTSFFL